MPRLLANIAALALFVGAVAAAPPARAQQFNDAQRSEIGQIVHDYLLKNPEVLREAIGELEKRQRVEEAQQRETAIETVKSKIFDSKYQVVVGNPDGKVSIVEFYDYNCGFCKRALEDMQALTAADPDLRFVLKEFPILGPDSQKAHIVASAFQRLMPEKYAEFHNRFLGGQGRATEASAMKLALELGADEAKLREEMKDPAIGDNFSKTYELANKLAITGTPSYVVGNEVVFGALGKDVLEQKIAAARACGDTGNC